MKCVKILRTLLVLLSVTAFLSSCEPLDEPGVKSIEGTWKCEEQHYEYGEQVYYVDIESSPADSSEVKIYNFLGLNASLDDNLFVFAKVNGSSLIIEQQNIDDHKVHGSGTISSNYKMINLNYIDDIYGDGGGTVTAVYTKE